MTRCPCCGAETTAQILVGVEVGVISAGDKSARISHGAQTQIASMLVSAMPGVVTRAAIRDALWGIGIEASAYDPHKVVDVNLVSVRRAFAEVGYAVVNERGVGWRLVPGAEGWA